MKATQFIRLLSVAIVIAIAATGCKKKPVNVTDIPNNANKGVNGNGSGVADPGKAPPLGGAENNPSGLQGNNVPPGSEIGSQGYSGTPANPAGSHAGWPENATIFAADTVYFAYDSAAVGGSEQSKVGHIADYLNSHKEDAVRVEGNCDERGTEEYNRALGDRRALAIREELIKKGIEPGRVDTISYGKDKPADPAHDEAAWKKNRRGDFILLTPPAKP